MTEKSEKSKMSSQTKHIPKDAQVIMSIMKDMGIVDYEPRVINQLLEFTYRYVTCILDDARVFANHAKKKVIDLDDVRLAVQMQLDKSFTTPPPREVLLDVARSKNITPLPLIKPHCGLRLPPDRYCLSSCNYKLVKTHIPKKLPMKNALGGTPKMNNKGSNQMVVKRQTLVTVSKTQAVNVPKPVFKFSSGNKVISKAAPKISNQQSVVKMETDDSQAMKRKREDDDYDVL